MDDVIDASSVGVTPNAGLLGDVFGIKVFTDSPIIGVDDAVDAVLADFILNRSSSSSASSASSSLTPLISAADLRQFLAYASSRQVELTSEAKTLITGYYMYSRKRRSSGATSSFGVSHEAASATFPASAISTLTSLAMAHAKLRMYDDVSSYCTLQCAQIRAVNAKVSNLICILQFFFSGHESLYG